MGQSLCQVLQICSQIGRHEAVKSIQRLFQELFGWIRRINSRMPAISGLMPMMLITRGEIVSQYGKRHLGLHVVQPLHQEVCRAHARLDRPERMFDRLTAQAHRVRVLIKTALDLVEHVLVFPPGDPALLAGVHFAFMQQRAHALVQ